MILQVQNIHKSYGKQKVLKDITFTIDKPEIVALVGPNGSGKSTLLSIITNLLSAESGEVRILNRTNKDLGIFREISFMQDNTVLYDYLTGFDHLQFIADLQGLTKEQIMENAERIGITSYLHKTVSNYSLGMKQHLLLAMATLNRPKLLILDEPLNGLDPTSSIKVRNLLIELNKEGTAILLSSHNLAEIDRVTSRVLFLKDGTLMDEDLSQFEQACYLITVNQPLYAVELLQKSGIQTVESNEKLSIYSNDTSIHEVISLLVKNELTILDIEKKVIGSEDRYRKIFEAEKDIAL
ncbi:MULTISPECIES: ABC transporter ATP-binding protein [Sutcliffiella]|uniref:ABC transporter ATP-binding protein n=1 Tax=Sutcliffiella cohnii TaxID=33932 RepID=A0A223KSB2_9BACI|nr:MULTISPECIES: ABC transporter ATP-binding protein [Sutcliffiella]AST92370.1 ABC transporter ATP-binding protein [Sutcliffiella cohnii]MED4017165.1 ABC transporter ATP-binding protein [Sutcliffiella cohnii]WBL13602.1 ABC transporter ATP-binding protein [Sutcliffiella sp. NC1]